MSTKNIDTILTHYNQMRPVKTDLIETGGGGDCLFFSLAYCLTNKEKDVNQKNILRGYLKDYYQAGEFDAIQVYTKINDFAAIELQRELGIFINKYKDSNKFLNLLEYFQNAQNIDDTEIKGLVLKPFENMGIFYNNEKRKLYFDENQIVLPVKRNLGKMEDIGKSLLVGNIERSEPVVSEGYKIFEYKYGDYVIDFDRGIGNLLPNTGIDPIKEELSNIIKSTKAYKTVLAECGFYFKNQNTKHPFLHFIPGNGYRGGPMGYWTQTNINRINTDREGKKFLENFLNPFKQLYGEFVLTRNHWGDHHDIKIIEDLLSFQNGKKYNIIVFQLPDRHQCINYRKNNIIDINDPQNIFLTIYTLGNYHFQAIGLTLNNLPRTSKFDNDGLPLQIKEYINNCGNLGFNNTFSSQHQNPTVLRTSHKKKSKDNFEVFLDPKSMEYYIIENGNNQRINTKCFIAHTKKGNFISFLQGNFLSVTDYQYLINPGDNQNYFYSDKRYKINKFRQDKSFCILVDLSKIKFPFNPYFLKLDNGNYVLYSKIVSFYEGTERIKFGIYGDMDINEVITKLNSEFTNIQQRGIFFENSHTFIQWLFPNTEFSPYNTDADLINDHTVRIWDISSVAQKNLKQILKIILKYWGFGDKLVTYRKDIVKTIFDVPNNHNWKRITRLLIFLREMGMGTLSKELHNHLIKIISAYFSNPKKQLSAALTKSMEIWKKEVIEKRELKQEFNNSDFTLQNIFEGN